MPSDITAERALLGACLLSADVAAEAVGEVRAEDFERDGHRRLFASIAKLASEGRAIDALTVADAMSANDSQKAYLIELCSAVVTTANWRGYAEIVADLASRRRRIVAARDIEAMAHDGADEEQIAAKAAEIADARHHASDVRTAADVLTDAARDWGRPREFYRLGQWGVRLRSGGVTLIGARPSVGKSAFAIQEAQELAERHVRCRVYSFEMSCEEYAERLLARNLNIPSEKIDDGLDRAQLDQTGRVAAEGWTRFFEIVDAAEMTLPSVIADMRRFARQRGRVVFVDYLQLMVKQSYEDVTEASRQLKLAARTTGLSVVALSQLSRKVAGHDGTLRPPTLTDLRQSGALEQDADNVLLLHTFEDEDACKSAYARFSTLGYNVADPIYEGSLLGVVTVAKNRRGAKGYHPAYFDGRGQIWSAVDRRSS